MNKRLIMIMLSVAFIAAGASLRVCAAKRHATSGGDNSRDILWNYDKKTKVLTISPNKGKKVKKQNLSDLEDWMDYAEKVVYKKGVKSLYPTFYPYGDGTFRPYNKLKSVIVCGNIKRLDNSCFEGCGSLNKVVLKSGINYIGNDAFNSTDITKLKLPSSVTTIGNYSFEDSKLETIDMNEDLKRIGVGAFSGTMIREIDIPDSVDYIGDTAFEDCELLESVSLPDGLTCVGFGLFSGNRSLMCVGLPDTITSIESEAFAFTNLKEVIIPRNVESLGDSFYGTVGVGGIFWGCDDLCKISIMSKKIREVHSKAMSGISTNATIEVPVGYKDKYTEMFKQGGLPEGVRIVEIEVNDSELDSVRLNKSKLKLKAKCNRKLELMNTDEPDKVVWKSSDSKVVKIDSSGNARSVAPGKAKITAIYKNHKYVCKVTVTKADANNDEAELKKLIKKQRHWGNLRVSTNIHSKQYKWKKGRLVAIKWSDTEAIGKINLNPFTYLETFDISEAWDDGYVSGLGQYICEIYADDLKHLKKIDLSETFHNRDLPDEFIHTENSPNVKVIREAED